MAALFRELRRHGRRRRGRGEREREREGENTKFTGAGKGYVVTQTKGGRSHKMSGHTN